MVAKYLLYNPLQTASMRFGAWAVSRRCQVESYFETTW